MIKAIPVYFLLLVSLPAQDLFRYHGDVIPPSVEAMYTKGLSFLVSSQDASGGWGDSYGSQPGVIGLAVFHEKGAQPRAEMIRRAGARPFAEAPLIRARD